MSEDRSSVGVPSELTPKLSPEDKETLLGLARRSILEYLDQRKLPRWESDSPALLEPRAAFVTLRRRDTGELRGCRGMCPASRPLIESVLSAAIASAVDDSRFSPVTIEELPELRIEISALTPMRPIDPDEVTVGRHGLMIVKGIDSGLLLPQVATRYGWDRTEFLTWVCRKANLADDAWRGGDVQLFAFETETWSEVE